jgi:hypothetical protein
MTNPRLLVFLAVLFSSSAAMAAGLPHIASITPASGSIAGGDAVTITTENLPFDCPVCSPPYAISVSFGSARSLDVRFTQDGNTLTAITPPHAAGPVDVIVSNNYYVISTTTTNGFTYTTQFDADTVEPILVPAPLVPASAPLPGAGGSRWASELFLRNGSLTQVTAFLGDRQCLTCDPPSLPAEAQPGVVIQLEGDSTLPGHMLYVQKSEVTFFAFSLRVRDLSGAVQNDGTELPVVRASRLTKGPIELLNVPLNSTSRAALRLFETDVAAGIDPVAQVTVTSMTDPQVSGSVRVTLAHDQSSGFSGILRAPGYATINDLKQFLNLPEGRYHIEVVPVAYEGWAYVALSNNQTQLVTAITPN